MRNLKSTKFMLIGLLLIISIVGVVCTAPSEEPVQTPSSNVPSKETPSVKPIELTFASMEIESSCTAKGQQRWVNKIEEESNGKVDIIEHWGAVLVTPPQAYVELSGGAYDIGAVLPQIAPSGTFPVMEQLQYFFHGAPDLETGISVYEEIFAKYPVVRDEYSKVKVLGIYPGGYYDLYTTKKPIHSIADIKGMSIRKGGVAIETFASLEAEGVNLPMSESILSLQKGILDGIFSFPNFLKSYKLAEVVKYGTVMNLYGGPFVDVAMNLDKWNSLPADIQKVFEDNVDTLSQAMIEARAEDIDDALAYAKEKEVEISQLPQAELNKFLDIQKDTAMQLAAKLDAQGFPGTELYKEVQRLIAERK